MQRVDQHAAVRAAGLLHDGDGFAERRHREDRQELEHDDDAGRRRPVAELGEALDDRAALGRATRHQHVAGAELGGDVDEGITRVVIATEDHRLDVERDDPRRAAVGW